MGNIEWLSEVADELIKCNLLHMNSGNVSKMIAFYISHRLSSCQFCDEITVFNDGEIVQKGTHAELVKDTEGQYYKLWNAQAKYYQSA